MEEASLFNAQAKVESIPLLTTQKHPCTHAHTHAHTHPHAHTPVHRHSPAAAQRRPAPLQCASAPQGVVQCHTAPTCEQTVRKTGWLDSV